MGIVLVFYKDLHEQGFYKHTYRRREEHNHNLKGSFYGGLQKFDLCDQIHNRWSYLTESKNISSLYQHSAKGYSELNGNDSTLGQRYGFRPYIFLQYN